MPSKHKEKMLRVDRLNRMEKSRLEFMIRRYDKEKISLVHEIDREKRAVVKDFAHVRRTSGFSEEAVRPSNEKDEEFKNDSFIKLGLRNGHKRLHSAKSQRSCSSRSHSHFDINGNFQHPRIPSHSSGSDEDVFITEEVSSLPLPDFSNMADIERYEKELIESYKNVFKNTEISVKKSDRKNLNRFLRSRSEVNNRKLLRPQTAKNTMTMEPRLTLPIRPSTANNGTLNVQRTMQENGSNFELRSYNSEKSLTTSDNNIPTINVDSLETVSEQTINPSVKQLIEQILEEESQDQNTQTSYILNGNNHKIKPETGILKSRKASTSTNQTFDIDTENNLRMQRQNSATGVRQRKVSINSTVSGFDSSVISNMWGSIGDISLDSNGQRKPSNWRKYVSAENAPIPETKRLVTLTTVVKAALAFSKTARKRALDKLVEEQTVDTRQVIKEERLRRLQSRNSVLMSLSSQFTVNGEEQFALMEENLS